MESQESYDFDHDHYSSESSYKFEEDQSSLVANPITSLKTTFNQLDKDRQGYIRKSALKKTLMLTSEHYDKEIIHQQIDLCEQEINFSKFADIFQKANVGDSINEELFKMYDKDRKGYIEAGDLRRASQITGVELTEEEVQQMVRTERNRGNGLVDFEDFKYFMEEELQYL